jgi:small subunit ribosomal protein S17
LNSESEMENQEQGTVEERGRRKTRVGTVISDKMEKTVVVSVERRYAHPLYGKQVTRSKKYHAHDESNEAKSGDLVRIVETRPLSKTKRWRVEEVVEKAK